jgi:hypothetical protein
MLLGIVAVVAFILGLVFAPAIRTDIVTTEDHVKALYVAEKAALKATAQKLTNKL